MSSRTSGQLVRRRWRDTFEGMKVPWTRRRFIKWALGGGAAAAVLGLGYSAAEAGWIRVAEEKLSVPRLPKAFAGVKIAFLTDIHHGPWTGLGYVRAVVARANELRPDLILLGGDYVHRDACYAEPCFDVLSGLKAPMGVFGVLGNHDHWTDAVRCKAAMRAARITELTNTGVWLEKVAAKLRLCGVGDLWGDVQELDLALDDAGAGDAAILLSHNPDFAEVMTDTRVGLMLSGHTHGGQVVLPLYGAPFVPSRFGQKYLRGLIATPWSQVYVSRGLGTITPPLRFCCRPEINLITLASPA